MKIDISKLFVGDGDTDGFEVYQKLLTEKEESDSVLEDRLIHILEEATYPKVQKDLADWLQTNPSVIRDLIRSLRRQEYPVCTSSKGVYLSYADLRKTINHMAARVHSMIITILAMKRIEIPEECQTFGGQRELEL